MEAVCYPGSLYGRGVQGHIGDTLVHRWVLGLSGKIVLMFDLRTFAEGMGSQARARINLVSLVTHIPYIYYQFPT